MAMLDRILRSIAPGVALARERNRAALDVLQQVSMRYDAATPGNRGKSFRPLATDADAAAAQRARLAYVARDMIRNTPFAVRAQQVIGSNVVGDGIIPKITADDPAAKALLLRAIEEHLDTTAIDADGRANLYGLQRLALNAIVDSGEVLIRRRRRLRSDGLALPFQLQLLEPDFLDVSRDGTTVDGNTVREGIEYDKIGRRAAYWLYPEHPGGTWRTRLNQESKRVPASEVLHIFRQDRPGQMRGVSWFAPIALSLQDLGDHQDAQLMRQKIAACFAAFRVAPEDEKEGTDAAGLAETIIPGRIQNLAPGEDIRFSAPPAVQGYGEFNRWVLLSVASGLGITYEALTGDLGNVNFSSGRMGRMEMDRNVSAWQWLMMIPQMMQPIGRWILEDWHLQQMGSKADIRLDWVPPQRMLVDPTREIPAMTQTIRAGLASRQGVVRQLGVDPERLMQEIKADADQADSLGLIFDSDPRHVSTAGVMQTDPATGSDTLQGGTP